LVLGRVQRAQDLGRPVGQQPARVGQPDAPARPPDPPDAGLGLEPGQGVADRRLGVVELPGRGRDRPVPGHRDQDAESRHVQHVTTIDETNLFGLRAIYGLLTDFGPCPMAATWSSARTATPAPSPPWATTPAS